jgi:hypothetical protein
MGRTRRSRPPTGFWSTKNFWAPIAETDDGLVATENVIR